METRITWSALLPGAVDFIVSQSPNCFRDRNRQLHLVDLREEVRNSSPNGCEDVRSLRILPWRGWTWIEKASLNWEAAGQSPVSVSAYTQWDPKLQILHLTPRGSDFKKICSAD